MVCRKSGKAGRMPKKVRFRVIYSSGWEDNHPAKELEVHNPFVKGWRSPRYCQYPQELVLRLDSPVRIRKLQLLSHQHMIAGKIELYVGRLPAGGHRSLDHTHFSRLGYISLSDNEQTGFRSRELKSVNLDVYGQLVKLVLHQNHINRLNVFNQVGLVALNVIADSPNDLNVAGSGNIPSHVTHMVARQPKETLSEVVHSYLPPCHHSQETDPVLLGAINKPSHISPLDDLAFAVAQDPETANLIRHLDSKKQTAVRAEKFDLAKQLKLVIAELQKVGEVLCRFEVEKRLAVEREDYDTAKEKKWQADQLRQKVYQHHGIHSLLNGDTPHPLPSHLSPHHPPPSDRSHPRVRNLPFAVDSIDSSPPHQVTHTNFSPSPQEGLERSPLLPPIGPVHSITGPSPQRHNTGDERPLPSLVNKSPHQQDSEARPDQEPITSMAPGSPPVASEVEQPEPLSEKQLKETPHAVEVFGMETMEHVYAKQFSLRERGLRKVEEELSSHEPHSRREVSTAVRATCEVVQKALRDNVLSSFNMALDLLRYLVGPYCKKHKLGKSELTYIIEKSFPVLLSRTGDNAPRIRGPAMDAVLELMQLEQIKKLALIGPLLMQPFKTRSTPWRLVKSQVDLLDHLIHEVGMAGSGITTKTVMEFLSPCLKHISGEVRDSAAKLTLDLYRTYGREVRRLLPVRDEVAARKKTFWKALFEGFDRVDGVPTQAEEEAAMLAAEKAKQDEIRRLQAQVTTLRDLTARNQSTTEGELAGVLGTLREERGGGGEQLEEEEAGPGIGDHTHQDARKQAELDKTCVFCGERREDFTEDGLEKHYLNECPMLQPCQYCSQVVEIAGLTRHWLAECEAKTRLRECPRCREAVQVAQFNSHVGAGSCPVAHRGDSNRCPLCHSDIPAGDESWRTHLIGAASSGCAKNPRRRRKKPAGRGIPRAIHPVRRTVNKNPQSQRRHK